MGFLRLILALSVVLGHSSSFFGLTLVGGRVAVELFFVISGFYMSLILDQKYPATRAGTYTFYTNRFLRIYPLYWFVLLLQVVLQLIDAFSQFHPGVLPTIQNWSKYHHGFGLDEMLLLAVSNLGIVGLDVGFFFRFDQSHLALTAASMQHLPRAFEFYFLPQAWTLSLELLVYIMAPKLFRCSLPVLFGVGLTSLLARILAHWSGLDYDPWTYRFLPFELCFFVAGSILYRCYEAFKTSRAFLIASRLSPVSVVFVIFYGNTPVASHYWLEPLLMLVVSLSVPLLFSLTRSSKLDRWIGELSYPVYLCHLTIIPLCNGDFGLEGWKPVVGSLLLSVALVLLLETPLDRYRQFRAKAARVRTGRRATVGLDPQHGVPR